MIVSTLFDSCLIVIAKNICHVESFAGFPDMIGKQIFDSVEAAGKFAIRNEAEVRLVLSLFTTAYKDQVLSALSTEGEHLMLADCMEKLMLFSHLRALNVSSCGLGDEHELLYHISTLESLQVLLLGDNCLTDEGIRKFTAPVRVKKMGLLNLQTLDLSGNDVSSRCLRFIRIFSKLQVLNLSNTAVKNHQLQSQELQEYAKAMSLMVKTALPERLSANIAEILEVKTQGWAEKIIHHWITHSRQPRRSRQSVITSNSKAKRFYGRPRLSVRHTPLVATCTDRQMQNKRTRDSSGLSLVLVNIDFLSSYAQIKTPNADNHSSLPRSSSSCTSLHSANPVTDSFLSPSLLTSSVLSAR